MDYILKQNLHYTSLYFDHSHPTSSTTSPNELTWTVGEEMILFNNLFTKKVELLLKSIGNIMNFTEYVKHQGNKSVNIHSVDESKILDKIHTSNKTGKSTVVSIIRQHPALVPVPNSEWLKSIEDCLSHMTNVVSGESAAPSSSNSISTSTGTTIVYCNMRAVAVSLYALFQSLQSRYKIIKSERKSKEEANVVDGVSNKCPIQSELLLGGKSMTYQSKALINLKTGVSNLLFATDVAQEGLDIQRCNTIIHFDGPKTVIGFIQRRGRARSQKSIVLHLIASPDTAVMTTAIFAVPHLIKCNNNKQIPSAILSKQPTGYTTLSNKGIEELKDIINFSYDEDYTNAVMKKFLENTEKFVVTTKEYRLACRDDRYVVPITKAYVDLTSAKSRLEEICQFYATNYDFCGKENYRNPCVFHIPMYLFKRYTEQGLDQQPSLCRFEVTLYLPIYLVPTPFVKEGSNKSIVKGQVAIQAIKYLHQQKLIDDSLQPIRTKSAKSESAGCDREETINTGEVAIEQEEIELEHVDEEGDASDDVESSNMIKVPVKVLPDCFSIYTRKNDDQYYVYHIHFQHVPNINQATPLLKEIYQFEAMKNIGIITRSLLPDIVSSSLLPFSLKGYYANTHMYFSLIEKRSFSTQELALAQAYHRGICGLQAPLEVTSRLVQNQYGFYSIPFSQNDHNMLSYCTYQNEDVWSQSSNGMWYIIFPIAHNAISTQQVTSAYWSIPYLVRCVDEITMMTLNFAVIAKNEQASINTDICVPLPTNVIDEHSLDEYVENRYVGNIVTTNGRNLLTCNSMDRKDTRLLTDSMNGSRKKVSSMAIATLSDGSGAIAVNKPQSKANKRFIDQFYAKRGEASKAYLSNFFSHSNENGISFATASAEEDGETLFRMMLYKGYSIDGRLSSIDVFDTFHTATDVELDATSATAKKASKKTKLATPVSAGEVYLYPAFCLPIGKISHLYLSLVLPLVMYRLTNACLAAELHNKLFQNPFSAKDSLYPLILQAMSTKRINNRINSERFV
jgi:hypothetical protein